MKRLTLFLITFLFLLTSIACQTTQTTTSTTSSQTTTTQSTSTSQTNSTTLSTQTTTQTTTTPTTQSTSTTTTTTSDLKEPFRPTSFQTIQDHMDVVGIPSVGDLRILVFAVDFSDYPANQSGITINQIQTAFNGTSSSMDFESVSSYYFKSSYGKLNLTADVFGFYRADEPSSYYENEYEKLYAVDEFGDYIYGDDEITYPDSDLIYELLLHYDNQIDYSDYDANNDGFIDAVYVIYTAPVSFDEGSDLWWAYQDIYIYEGDIFDGVEPYFFMWAGVDFFFEGSDALNARTIIHETGHLLGLEDYYDYDTEGEMNFGGLGGADMMDNTIGDHNPFSKLTLGWITPLVVTESMTVVINPFESSGDVLLIKNVWNNTIFDEYFLVSFYTPTGLNEADKDGIFTIPGVLIYHVTAQIAETMDEDSYYPSIYQYNNTDTVHKLLKIIEADMGNEIDDYGIAENSDLFQTGDGFKQTIYPNYEWNTITPKSISFTITIISIENNQATVRIDFAN